MLKELCQQQALIISGVTVVGKGIEIIAKVYP